MNTPINVLILAAGLGTRMKSDQAKVLHKLGSRPLIAHVAKHNIGSIRVLQKCGFTISGEERFPVADGKLGEEYILKLTARE